MQSSLLISVLFLFFAFAYGGPSSDRKKHNHGPPMCAGKNLTTTAAMMKITKDCWEKHNGKSEDTKKTKEEKHNGMMCYMVCDAQGNGLISADGKIVKSKVTDFVKQVYPESVTADLTKAFSACADEHGTNVAIKDGKCDSYDALFTCVEKAKITACKADKSKA